MEFGRGADRRAHVRTTGKLPGRLMLANRRECACTIIDVSQGGIGLMARERGEMGETVVLYVSDVGRIEGKIVRLFEGGFAIRLNGTSRAAELLARRFVMA